ncbi:MAG: GIY-YIG nuclease family protein [Symploca sp. SIO2D2]|nr:GIY-YIG nuclease family protein [Symploca sp. SIO2D2]
MNQFYHNPSANREGYIYLFHAVGTNRYKIGRSVNPISRLKTVERQSPYPLKIIDSFWSPDAIADEQGLHENFQKYRVHGEWFESRDNTLLHYCRCSFEFCRPVARRCAQEAISAIKKDFLQDPKYKFIGTALKDDNQLDWGDINMLFHFPTNFSEFMDVNVFLCNTLPFLLRFSNPQSIDEFCDTSICAIETYKESHCWEY